MVFSGCRQNGKLPVKQTTTRLRSVKETVNFDETDSAWNGCLKKLEKVAAKKNMLRNDEKKQAEETIQKKNSPR